MEAVGALSPNQRAVVAWLLRGGAARALAIAAATLPPHLTLQSGQQPSKAERQMPQFSSSFVCQCHVATIRHLTLSCSGGLLICASVGKGVD